MFMSINGLGHRWLATKNDLATYIWFSDIQIWDILASATKLRQSSIDYERTMNEQIYVLTSQKKATNHILHLLMCIPTFGLWLLVWGVTMRSNDSHNRKIDKQIQQIMKYKVQGLSDAETYRQIEADKSNSGVKVGQVIFVVLLVMFIYICLRQ